MHRYKIERWTGKAWDSFPGVVYKTMSEVNKHLTNYWWHYTNDNPYRVVDFKPKKKVQQYVPKYNLQDWNSDAGMVVKI